MIYLVTLQQLLFESPYYKVISVEESLELLKECDILQADSETNGKDPHICDLLCFQLGNKRKDFQIVIDCTTIDITKYKEVLENTLLVFQNGKFDLQFLYNYNIIPRNVYDTMIVEQLLYLGYPKGVISFSLQSIAKRRLNLDVDKTIRGEIIWRGLDDSVIKYAAHDVEILEDIMQSQVLECKQKKCLVGAKLECNCVPAMAYLEWCGIKLDEKKWSEKMTKDKEALIKATEALNKYACTNPKLSKFTKIELQGSLFDGFDTDPKCIVKWSSSKQVVEVAKVLGFDTTVQDKKTGEDKDSVIEKHLSNQKGIDDTFLKLYFNYQEQAKVVSSFGQGHLNDINPNTGRIHTVYRQIGTTSGRMSCGSQQPNTDLAKLKKIPPKECTYPNMQQLPHDELTRSCFIAEKGNLFCSCDYSAMEARIGADVYNEQMLLDEFLLRSGDTHAAYAKVVFSEELKDIDTKDIKAKRPDLRNKVKAVEFSGFPI